MHLIALIAVALVIPGMAQAADVDVIRHSPRAKSFYSDGGYYRGRGIFQDSGWAYEVPVYDECQVRIVQTPRGIDRTRRCAGLVTARIF